MIRCTFMLNSYGLSTLSVPGVGFFPAYSGNAGEHRNNPNSVAVKEVGPLPPGRYYIVDRPTGGRLKWFYEKKDSVDSLLSGSDRSLWFGLYRDDSNLDDNTFIDQVERGTFRLHPAGYSGVSNGCITLPFHSHYTILRDALLRTATIKPSASLTAYGTIQVY
jgi:Protein of unknown function (DUF2778)